MSFVTLTQEQLDIIDIYQRHELDGLSFEEICGELYVEYINGVRKLKLKIDDAKNKKRRAQIAMNNKGNDTNAKGEQGNRNAATGLRNNGFGRRGLPKNIRS